MPSPILDAAARNKAALAAKDAQAMGRLVANYRRSYNRLETLLSALVAEIGDNPPTRGQLVRMERYRALMTQTLDEMTALGGMTRNEIEAAAKLGIQLGQTDAANLMSTAAVGDASIAAGFNRLPRGAIEQMLAFLDPAGPLYARLKLMAPTVTDAVSEAILQGVTLGYNPRKIAAMVTKEFGAALTDSMRFVRTAQLWAYRESNRATFLANSDVVTGWVWSAELDDTTCASCWAMHGTVHPLDEPLNDHHNGRCAPIPLVKGFDNPITESGADAFDKLSEAEQRAILGAGKYDAWKGGEFEFSALTTTRRDDVYGDMRTAAPLWELLGTEPPHRTK